VTTTILASFPSPSQGVWHLGPIPIRAYALLILTGVIVALFLGDRRWAARGGERGVVFDIALWAIIFGLIGGRLYHVLTDWNTYFGPDGAGFWAAFKIQEGGLGIWGAVALGGVGAWIGCRRRGIPLPAFGDAVAPGIVLAQAIGRIGNYFNQELYGRSTSLPWGLEIYQREDANGAADSLNGVSTGQLLEPMPVHPTFLYELLWNLLVFALLIWVDRRFRIGHGRLFALYVAAYCFGRFWIELMRSDMATHIAGIRINSFVSMFVFIGAVIYIMVAPKGREDPSELRGNVAFGEKVAPDAEDAPTEKFEKELVAVAATTGVVAAAKAAGEKEDEDAAEEKTGSEDTEASEIEAVAESEQLVEDVSDASSADIAEAEAFAEAGEEADAAEDVAATEALGGVGAVEGDEVVEAEESAPEVHEAAVENAEEAAEIADELAAKQEEPTNQSASDAEGAVEDAEHSADDEAAEADAVEDAAVTEAAGGVGAVEGDEVAADQPEESADLESETAAESDEPESAEEQAEDAGDESVEPEAEAAGGVGAVEGDEVVEAEEAAPEVHEAVVEDAGEAAVTADEVAADQPEESAEQVSETAAESDEPESAEEQAEDAGDESVEPETEAVGGVGAVDGDGVVQAEAAAPEVHQAAAEGAEEKVGRIRRRFGFRRRRSN
jgi:prolipoprotein diacylglyceryl transferase